MKLAFVQSILVGHVLSELSKLDSSQVGAGYSIILAILYKLLKELPSCNRSSWKVVHNISLDTGHATLLFKIGKVFKIL